MKTSSFSAARGKLLAVLAGFLFLTCHFSGAAEAPRSGAPDNSKPPELVYIGGEVTIPGRYIYTNGMTLRAAIKMAKGATVRASKKMVLTRKGEKPLTLDREAIEQGKAKDIELHPDDTIHFVPGK